MVFERILLSFSYVSFTRYFGIFNTRTTESLIMYLSCVYRSSIDSLLGPTVNYQCPKCQKILSSRKSLRHHMGAYIMCMCVCVCVCV